MSLDKKNMVSTSTQCSSLTDNIPLRVAAGLTPVLQQHAVENVEDNDDDSDIEGGDIEGSDEDPDFDLDSEYPESDSSDEEDEEFQLSTDITPEEERQFLVSEVQLAKLLQNCSVCGSACHTVVNGVRGTMISTSSVCPNGHSSTRVLGKAKDAIMECHGQICWLPVLLCLVERMPQKASDSFDI